jgi:hypothetical protein
MSPLTYCRLVAHPRSHRAALAAAALTMAASLAACGFPPLGNDNDDYRGPPALLFLDGDSVSIVEQGTEPELLGHGHGPDWAGKGRYAAWLTADRTLQVFDRASDEQRTARISGTLQPYRVFGTTDLIAVTFVDVVSPASVVWIDPERLFDQPPGKSPIDAEVGSWSLAALGGADFAAEWSDAPGDTLYAAISDWDGTRYFHNPALWAVPSDGVPEQLFADCEGTSCDNQRGMWHVAVSPDETLVAYEGGTRNGCESYPQLVLSTLDDYAPVALSGIPTELLYVRSISWADDDEFVVVASHEQSSVCDAAELGPSSVWRCGRDGACAATGDDAEWISAGPVRAAATAVAFDDTADPRSYDVEVDWGDGTPTTTLQMSEPPSWSV